MRILLGNLFASRQLLNRGVNGRQLLFYSISRSFKTKLISSKKIPHSIQERLLSLQGPERSLEQETTKRSLERMSPSLKQERMSPFQSLSGPNLEFWKEFIAKLNSCHFIAKAHPSAYYGQTKQLEKAWSLIKRGQAPFKNIEKNIDLLLKNYCFTPDKGKDLKRVAKFLKVDQSDDWCNQHIDVRDAAKTKEHRDKAIAFLYAKAMYWSFDNRQEWKMEKMNWIPKDFKGLTPKHIAILAKLVSRPTFVVWVKRYLRQSGITIDLNNDDEMSKLGPELLAIVGYVKKLPKDVVAQKIGTESMESRVYSTLLKSLLDGLTLQEYDMKYRDMVETTSCLAQRFNVANLLTFYFNQDEPERSITLFQRFYQLDPKKVDDIILHVYINGLVECGKIEEAVSSFDLFALSGLHPHASTVAACITACRLKGMHQTALSLYHQSKDSLNSVNQVQLGSFVALLSAMKKNDEARNLIDKMANQFKIQPMTFMFIFRSYFLQRQYQNVVEYAKLLQENPQSRHAVDYIPTKKFITCSLLALATNREELDDSISLYDSLINQIEKERDKDTHKLDLFYHDIFSILRSGYRDSIPLVRKLFNDMERLGIDPEPFDCFITSSNALGMPLNDLIEYIGDFRGAGSLMEYGAFIRVLWVCQRGGKKELVEELIEGYLESGRNVTPFIFNCILTLHIKDSREQFESILASHNTRWNARTFAIAIHFYYLKNRFDVAWVIWTNYLQANEKISILPTMAILLPCIALDKPKQLKMVWKRALVEFPLSDLVGRTVTWEYPPNPFSSTLSYLEHHSIDLGPEKHDKMDGNLMK